MHTNGTSYSLYGFLISQFSRILKAFTAFIIINVRKKGEMCAKGQAARTRRQQKKHAHCPSHTSLPDDHRACLLALCSLSCTLRLAFFPAVQKKRPLSAHSLSSVSFDFAISTHFRCFHSNFVFTARKKAKCAHSLSSVPFDFTIFTHFRCFHSISIIIVCNKVKCARRAGCKRQDTREKARPPPEPYLPTR